MIQPFCRSSTAIEASTSFLKKSSIKLSLCWATGCETSTAQRTESFLVLFFKKELLSFLSPDIQA
jgi:hypothetical protein